MTPVESLQTQEIRLVELLHKASVLKASDIHITAGSRPVVRIDGKITPLTEYPVLNPEMTQRLLYSVMSEKHRKQLEERGQVDFSFGVRI
jgi:twitching motility protein PilT